MSIEWRDIDGYEGYYQVNNLGEVRSLDRQILKSNGVVQNRKGYIIPQRTTDDGYMAVRLSKEAVRKEYKVHTLVARAFLDGWFDGAEVNHKDFNRTNNSSGNLEWVTHADNIQYTISNGRHVSQTRDFSGENNPNYNNHTLSERYRANPDYAREKQARTGAKNGRATPIKMIHEDGTCINFEYMAECALYMIEHKLCRSANISNVQPYISKAASTGSSYCGCSFEYIT